MKIVLIQPPVRDFYITPLRTQPAGLAYVAASLITQGYVVEILDCLTNEKKTIPVPAELSYLMEHYEFKDCGPFKLYTGFYHFGKSYEKIAELIINSGADIFGVSSMFTPYYKEALKIAELIKKWDKEKIVVFGGAHATCCPEQLLNSPDIDYVILGEGEKRFPLLLEKIKSGRLHELDGIDGIGYKSNGNPIINRMKISIEDPDELPYPSIGMFNEIKKIGNKPLTMLITSRGCPHKCTYCSHHVMGRFRMRRPESIIEEMKYNYSKFGIEAFDIEDDNFTYDIKRAKHLLKLIIKEFGEGGIGLMAMNGISFASLDRELIHLMVKAGFRTINLSYVSNDQSIRYMLNRPGPLMEFDEVVECAIAAGLGIIAYCIFGIPGQTIHEMSDTLIYLSGKKVLIGPSIYYPSPGTVLFDECKRSGSLPEFQTQWRSSAFPVETPDFSRLDLVTLFRLTRMINFIKGRIKAGDIPAGITWKDLYALFESERAENTDNITWRESILSVRKHLSFSYVIKSKNGTYNLIKAESSERVLEYFFAESSDRLIY